MQVLLEKTFSELRLEASALSFIYRQDLETVIDCTFLIQALGGDINDLKVKILFSNTKLETPDFSSAEENYVD